MRFLSGVITGVLLAEEPRIVNWDLAGKRVSRSLDVIREESTQANALNSVECYFGQRVCAPAEVRIGCGRPAPGMTSATSRRSSHMRLRRRCANGLLGQLLRLLQMMLNYRQCLVGELLHVGIIAAFCILLE